MMKSIAYPGRYGVLVLLAGCFLAACGKMDDPYKEYIRNTIYTGKVDSVQVYPGNNRVKLSFQLPADPKIRKVRVYWNNRADSAETSVQYTGGADLHELILEGLQERSYSFELFTYDDEGNSSVVVTASGSSYGENYRHTLLENRPCTGAAVNGADLSLDWAAAEENAVAVKLIYTDNSGELRTVYVPSAEDETILEDYKLGTRFSYQTGYLPEPMAIDTFYTLDAVVSDGVIDVSSVYLKNYIQPFEYTDYDGSRWGTLKDWIVNTAARNQGPAGNKIYGGIDNLNGSASFALSKYNADPPIHNGKIYQTVDLPAGTYEFSWTTVGNSVGANAGGDPRFLVVAAGDSLPDVAEVAGALAAETFTGKNTATTSFSLETGATVSVGVLVDWTGGNNAFRAHRVQLKVFPTD